VQDRQEAPRGQGGQPLALRLNDRLGRIPGGAVVLALLSCCSQLLDGDLDQLGDAYCFRLTVRPNVELTGPRRHGALAVRPMMNQGGRTARVPCRSGSG
jgi:hypothetical protein